MALFTTATQEGRAIAHVPLVRPFADLARAVLSADLALLVDLDSQVDQATEHLARLLPLSPFTPC